MFTLYELFIHVLTVENGQQIFLHQSHDLVSFSAQAPNRAVFSETLLGEVAYLDIVRVVAVRWLFSSS